MAPRHSPAQSSPVQPSTEVSPSPILIGPRPPVRGDSRLEVGRLLFPTRGIRKPKCEPSFFLIFPAAGRAAWLLSRGSVPPERVDEEAKLARPPRLGSTRGVSPSPAQHRFCSLTHSRSLDPASLNPAGSAQQARQLSLLSSTSLSRCHPLAAPTAGRRVSLTHERVSFFPFSCPTHPGLGLDTHPLAQRDV